MTAMNKRELRLFLRSLAKGKDERAAQSEALCRHILNSPAYASAAVIAGYVALPGEADITPVLTDAWRKGKRIALPLCDAAPRMTLREVTSLADLRPGAYGIPEPSGDAPIIPVQAVDLMLVPLEGIDREGYRLGKGGGYYDCLLAQARCPTMGCALRWQWTERVPRDSWDIPLDACADEAGIHGFHA